MTWQKEQVDGSTRQFNFIPPDGVASQEVLFPTAQLDVPEVELDEDENPVINVSVLQMDTFVQPEELTDDVTINLDIADQVTPGARLHLKLVSDDQADKTVTLGNGFDDDYAAINVGSEEVVFMSFVYDGSAFMPFCNPVVVESGT